MRVRYCISSAVSLDGLRCYYGVGWAIAPTNENLRGVGARTAFRAEDGWVRGHRTTTDAWEAFMLRPGDDWDGLGAAPHALSEPPIRIWKRGRHEQDRHGVPCWAKRGNRSTVAHAGPSPRVVRLLGHTIPEDGRLGTRIDGARRGARALRKSHDGEGWVEVGRKGSQGRSRDST